VKVLGTGSPMMLTLRVRSCEVAVLRDVLCARRAEAVASAALQAPEVAATCDVDRERPHDEMFAISKALDDLRRHTPPEQPRVIVGPTWLLDSVIRDAASEAVERLSEAVDVFRADTGRMSADTVRTASETASASVATLLGLDYVQNHAVE
jgi:hypothetical protein